MNEENMMQEMSEIIRKLPKENKKIIHFFIMNMETVEKLASLLPLTKEESNKLYAEAIKDKNYILATIFHYKSFIGTQLNQGG